MADNGLGSPNQGGVVATFMNNLFGSIATQSAGLARLTGNLGFIPVDGNGNTLDIRNNTATWLGLKNRLMQKYAYDYCYAVSSVVDKLAKYDVTGKPRVKRLGGKGAKKDLTSDYGAQMARLFKRPNPLQSWESFRAQQVAYKKVFGFCPVLPVVLPGFEKQPWLTQVMINLPPWLFDVKAIGVATNRESSNADDASPGYVATILNKRIEFKESDLVILRDGLMFDESQNFALPTSKLVGLDWAVSNLLKAMEADNVLLAKKGPLGIFSHDPRTDPIAGYEPMMVEEKKELQASLDQYGLSHQQYQWLISRAAIKWQPMSFNVEELGTKATIAQCEKAISHRFNLPYVLYEETEATYTNNGDSAEAGVYQGVVIPENDGDLEEYERFFKATENNAEFVGDYSKVGALQGDKTLEADVASKNANTILTVLASPESVEVKKQLLKITLNMEDEDVDLLVEEKEPLQPITLTNGTTDNAGGKPGNPANPGKAANAV